MEILTLGIIGLGRMGMAIAQRAHKAGFKVFGYDTNQELCAQAHNLGITITESSKNLAQSVNIVWLMVPAGSIVDTVIEDIGPACRPQTIIVDGGNSNYKDTIRRARLLEERAIDYIDCGTSGGLHGETVGFSLMVGGKEKAYKKLEPLFRAIAAPEGFAYMGPPGAGHYVKMVHNGIEYALLQAYAEGCHLLKEGHYPNLDLESIAKVWKNGSVIRSWIVELLEEIFHEDQELKDISGAIGENLTGRWTSDEAHDRNIPIKLIDDSLAIRAWSRETGGNYGTKVVAMLRKKFGGHALEKFTKKHGNS